MDPKNNDRRVYKKILDALKRGSVLLHSPGGCGKSFIIRGLAKKLVAQKKIVYVTATTGKAAINLNTPEVEASTLHRWAGIGLGDDDAETLLGKVTKHREAKLRWINVDLLIIDEVSMLSLKLFEKLNYIAQKIRESKNPFGGIKLLLSGDFLQLSPVNDRWVFLSNAWKKLDPTPIILTEPKRYTDLDYYSRLLRIRKGEHTSDDVKFLKRQVKKYKQYEKNLTTIEQVKPTIIYPKNEDVNAYNMEQLEKLQGDSKTFIAYDALTRKKGSPSISFYKPFLDDAIPESITLKVGAQVMLKFNVDVPGELANGSRGVITGILPPTAPDAPDRVQVLWLNGNTTFVTAVTWKVSDTYAAVTRTQLPLVLAWAITVHKSQGATLDYAVVDCGESIFCDGQAYVALSRVRSSDGLFLSNFSPSAIQTNTEALEYVKSIEKDTLVPKKPPNGFSRGVVFKKISDDFSLTKDNFCGYIGIEKNTYHISYFEKANGLIWSWNKKAIVSKKPEIERSEKLGSKIDVKVESLLDFLNLVPKKKCRVNICTFFQDFTPAIRDGRVIKVIDSLASFGVVLVFHT